MRRPQHLSRKGAAFIARYEGVALVPYNDPIGFATIGIGHLLHRSRVTRADRLAWRIFNRNKAYGMLMTDAERFARAIVLRGKHWKLNQAQFDALVSFSFNLGLGWMNWLPPTGLARALDRGDKKRAAQEIVRWDMAGGHHLPGLHNRRLAEAKLFRTGKYT